MKLVNSKYGLNIEFIENRVNTLVIEKPEFMSDIIQNIIFQIDGMEGSFVLSDEQEINFQRDVVLIAEPFNIDLNNRKIIGKLYGQLAEVAKEQVEDYNNINKNVIETLEKIYAGIAYNNINFNLEFDWKELFKLYNVKLEENYDTLYEKLEEYIKVLANILHPKLVIFLNLKKYLEKEQMENLLMSSFYNKITILLIESDEGYYLEKEKIYIIDKDRCLIVK